MSQVRETVRKEEKEAKTTKEKEKDSNKNNYEYICLNIRHHTDLFN